MTWGRGGYTGTASSSARCAQEAAQVAAGTLSVADLAACGAAFNPNRAFAIADPGNPRAVCPGRRS